MKAGGKEDLKKIENPKWWGGDLKDIYTDRRKKKVDYLEVSDVEDSDGTVASIYCSIDCHDASLSLHETHALHNCIIAAHSK